MKKEIKLFELVDEFVSGIIQMRINEVNDDEKAPVYKIYTQNNLMNDFENIKNEEIADLKESREIKTYDKMKLINKGDVIYSLISGMATLVTNDYENYILTQNYVKIIPKDILDKNFLIYLLNEDKNIKKQLMKKIQGTQILKYTISQIKELKIINLPTLEKQKIIGDIYIKQLKIKTLKRKNIERESLLIMKNLEEVIANGGKND